MGENNAVRGGIFPLLFLIFLGGCHAIPKTIFIPLKTVPRFSWIRPVEVRGQNLLMIYDEENEKNLRFFDKNGVLVHTIDFKKPIAMFKKINNMFVRSFDSIFCLGEYSNYFFIVNGQGKTIFFQQLKPQIDAGFKCEYNGRRGTNFSVDGKDFFLFRDVWPIDQDSCSIFKHWKLKSQFDRFEFKDSLRLVDSGLKNFYFRFMDSLDERISLSHGLVTKKYFIASEFPTDTIYLFDHQFHLQKAIRVKSKFSPIGWKNRKCLNRNMVPDNDPKEGCIGSMVYNAFRKEFYVVVVHKSELKAEWINRPKSILIFTDNFEFKKEVSLENPTDFSYQIIPFEDRILLLHHPALFPDNGITFQVLDRF